MFAFRISCMHVCIMDIINREQIKKLATWDEGYCVSMFIPTVKHGNGTEQNHIRFKNVLREADKRLTERHMRPSDRTRFLSPAQEYLNEDEMWEHQSDGLAVFLAQGVFETWRVPLALEELVVDGKRFHIKPLLPLLSGDGRYYVLAVSLGRADLYVATRHTIGKASVENMPKGIEETLAFDLKAKQPQTHPRGRAPGKERAAGFHGHDVAHENARKEARRYCRDIDHAIREKIADDTAPLVIVAEDYLAAICRDALSYSHVVPESVDRNPHAAETDDATIHARTWDIVSTLFKTKREEAVRKYQTLGAEGTTSNKLSDIVKSAFDARVEILFVPLEEHQWGTYDRESDTLEVHKDEHPGDEDLIDLAASQTLAHGGSVFTGTKHEIPNGALAAAVLRY